MIFLTAGWDLLPGGRRTVPDRKSRTEKRRWQRIALMMPVFVRGSDELGKEFLEFSTALNVSRGGVLLATRRYLQPSTRVSLQIPESPIPSAILPQPVLSNIAARVVNTRPTQSRGYHLSGLSFSHPLAAA